MAMDGPQVVVVDGQVMEVEGEVVSMEMTADTNEQFIDHFVNHEDRLPSPGEDTGDVQQDYNGGGEDVELVSDEQAVRQCILTALLDEGVDPAQDLAVGTAPLASLASCVDETC